MALHIKRVAVQPVNVRGWAPAQAQFAGTSSKLVNSLVLHSDSATGWITAVGSVRFSERRFRSSGPLSDGRRLVQSCAAADVLESDARVGENEDIVLPNAHTLPYKLVTQIWEHNAAAFGDDEAVNDPHQKPFVKLTYRQLHECMTDVAAGMRDAGLQRGDVVALFSENSSRWLMADAAIMLNGAADAVRGATAGTEELIHIMRQSDSSALVVQDAATLDKLLPELFDAARSSHGDNGATQHGSDNGNHAPAMKPLKFVMLLWGDADDSIRQRCPVPLFTFDDMQQRGRDAQRTARFEPPAIALSDLATLVYTSGTTGMPKGVMLTHANLMYQVLNIPVNARVDRGDATLSLLPPWHIYERAVTYFVFSRGVRQTYSNVRRFRDDLQRYPPDFLVAVPLLLDTLYKRVMQTVQKSPQPRAALASVLMSASKQYVHARRVLSGTSLLHAQHAVPWHTLALNAVIAATLQPLHSAAQLLVFGKIRDVVTIRKCIVSGGGSLSPHLEDFFECLGVPVVNGWGLTETSPVLAVRSNMSSVANVRGSVGLPLPGTEVRVVDADTMRDLPQGSTGLLLVRGPGVMKGYYKNADATASVITRDGWFDTGDLGWRAPGDGPMAGHIVLTGRAKEMIVLSNGKNIAPAAIEDACCQSAMIDNIALIGNDRRSLGALVCVNHDSLREHARGEAMSDDAVRRIVAHELRACNAARADYKPYEAIVDFEIVDEPFSADNGTLTRTMKLRRAAIERRYADAIARLSQRLR